MDTEKVNKRQKEAIDDKTELASGEEEWTLRIMELFDNICAEAVTKVRLDEKSTVDMVTLLEQAFTHKELSGKISSMAKDIMEDIAKLDTAEAFFDEAKNILVSAKDADLRDFLDIAVEVEPGTLYPIFAYIAQQLMNGIELLIENAASFAERKKDIRKYWYEIAVLSLAYRMAHGPVPSLIDLLGHSKKLQIQL